MASWEGYRNNGLESPCYNRKTKSSCAKRSTFCRQSCEKWKKYEEMKVEEYRNKKEQRMKNDEYYSYTRKNYIEREKTVRRLQGRKVSKR